MSKLLGIDYGTKRVGLAIANKEQRIALPFRTLHNNDEDSLLKELSKIIKENSITIIIMGLPLNMDGSPSKMSQEVRKISKKITDTLNIPIVLWDEQLSSFEAEELMKEMGLKKKKKKEIVDMIAAKVILDDYLNNHSFE